MSGPDRTGSFPVHGGTCTVVEYRHGETGAVDVDDLGENAIQIEGGPTDEDGIVHVRQTVFRHLHWLAWLLAALGVAMAAATLLTDWRYVTGTGEPLGPAEALVLGLIVPGTRALQLAWRRRRGYTAASTLRFDDVESVELTTTSIRWYMKTRRTVPVFVVAYRVDGAEKRRRISLKRRWTDEDLRAAVDAFRDAGLPFRVDDDARELLADAGR